MATPVTDPALLAQLNGGKSPVSDPTLLAQLNGTDQPSITDAVTDIPAEIGRTAGANLDTIKAGVTDRGSKGPIEGLMSTGKALMAIPGLIASPITGAARSLIGHPMAQAEHAVGTLINPEVAAKDDPQKMYQTAAGDVETALSAARPAVARPPVAPVPTVGELKAASRAGYNHPDVAAVEINPQSTSILSTRIESDLAQRGFRPANEPAVFSAVRELNPPAGVTSVRVADIDSARKVLGNIAKERDAVGAQTPRAAAANVAIDHINDYLPNIAPADVIAGDAGRASEILRDAQANWGAAKRAEGVDLQLTRADRQAAKSGAGMNVENSMRQKIATLLDNPKRTVGFSDPERAAMERIVRGSPMRNMLRTAGKAGVDGGLSLALNAGAAMGSGGATLPITAAGTISRILGQRLTAAEGRHLSEMVRSRSPAARGNIGTTAVSHALTRQAPRASAAIPYSAIVSALMQPQNQRMR
jgi:hypothetical protein